MRPDIRVPEPTFAIDLEPEEAVLFEHGGESHRPIGDAFGPEPSSRMISPGVNEEERRHKTHIRDTARGIAFIPILR